MVKFLRIFPAVIATCALWGTPSPATAAEKVPANSCDVVQTHVHSPNLTFTFTGRCVDGWVSGHGVLQWFNNGQPTTREEGEWSTGARRGRGINDYSSGDRFEGDFVAGEQTGKGVYLWLAGQRYEGDFVDGVMSGLGTLTDLNGDRYEGRFANDQQTGEGDVVKADGSRVHGAVIAMDTAQSLPAHLPTMRAACPNVMDAVETITYPMRAYKKGLYEGRVLVEFEVDGETSSNFVVKRSSDPVFESTALAAAKLLKCTSSQRVLIILPVVFETSR